MNAGNTRPSLFASRQAPERQRAFFQGLGMRRTAGVRIAFGRGQDRHCSFAFGASPQGAVPEIKVTLPVFQIALGRNDHSDLLSGFALERRQRESPRWSGDQAADRNYARAAVDVAKDSKEFSTGPNRTQRSLNYRRCFRVSRHYLSRYKTSPRSGRTKIAQHFSAGLSIIRESRAREAGDRV